MSIINDPNGQPESDPALAPAQCSAADDAIKAAAAKARKEAFTVAANYVHWARMQFKGHAEIEARFREMAEET